MRTLGALLAVVLSSTVLAADASLTAPTSRSTADAIRLNNDGAKLAQEGKFADAETNYRKALEIWTSVADRQITARDRAHTMENLGSLLRDVGRYREAEQILKDALAQLEEATGKESVDDGEALENLAALYRVKGDGDLAEQCALRADHLLLDRERSDNRILLAAIYIDKRRFAEARTILEPAREGATGMVAFTIYADLATAALGESQFSEAEEFAKKALEFTDSNPKPNSVGVAAVWNNLGQIYRFQKRYSEADQAYRKAIELWTAARGAAHPYVASGLLNFAAFEHERGRDSAAEQLYRRAAEIFEKTAGKGDLRALIARNELGDVLRAEKRYVAAEQLINGTLPALRELLPANDPRMVRALANYAQLLSDTKRQKQAAAVWKQIKGII